MQKKKEVLKIIFNLKKRSKYVKRYINLANQDYKNVSFDLLVITQKQNLFNKNYNFKILIKYSKKNIQGINDMFCEINKLKLLIKQYRYCCFVEDDNFIFPEALHNCEKFLDKNKKYIACLGNGFIFNKKNNKYFFLNKYNLPNKISNNKVIKRYEEYQGGLIYLGLFRVKYFLKIIECVIRIKDNNLSEIFFNFLTIKFGKINKIKELFLAREYPRPTIYNIPSRSAWIVKNSLPKETNFMMKVLDKKRSEKIMDHTIFSYISDRYKKPNKNNFLKKIIYLFKKYLFYLVNFKKINKFMMRINQL